MLPLTLVPPRRIVAFLLAALALLALAAPATAQSTDQQVQTAWRLLDYIAVDYREAVQGGRIINQLEYDEMIEFSGSVGELLGGLPARPQKPALVGHGRELRSAIEAKADPGLIAARARGLADALLAAYPVPMAPQARPDLQRGARLYADQCASCHGAKGEGPAGAFAELDPPPIAFTDRDRARDRSLFALYQVISQGLEGTAMQSYAALAEQDRWALAFHTGTLAYGDAALGERIWRSDAEVRRLIPDMAALVAITPADLERQVGAERAAALIAFLRSNPAALEANRPASLQLARDQLREALAAYAAGSRAHAGQLALSAYLDGFEPVEPVLATRDGRLMREVEQAMSAFRVAIARGEPVDMLRNRLADTEALLDRAEEALAPEASSAIATFLGAFAILLREGLEALLVVIAMIAFLRKAGRTEAMPYVHGGWIAALIAGGATWLAATYVIGISGAGREITEGAGALMAAIILLWVGIWMHGKSHADQWRRYIAEKLKGALSRGSAWFLFGLAFIVVYREVFETILFYAALWTADNGAMVLAGALTGTLVLAGLAWAMLRLSMVLPLGRFFFYSAILMAALAVVLAGKGIGAFQEAGVLPITPLPDVPRIAMLGIFPTAEAIAAQLLAFAAVVVGFRASSRPRKPVPAE
ncbi:MAG TPA: FTR1 family protein [Sphingomicrobium sp.]|nr:FTR1 family protein [Sphingomicrobium sp.]